MKIHLNKDNTDKELPVSQSSSSSDIVKNLSLSPKQLYDRYNSIDVNNFSQTGKMLLSWILTVGITIDPDTLIHDSGLGSMEVFVSNFWKAGLGKLKYSHANYLPHVKQAIEQYGLVDLASGYGSYIDMSKGKEILWNADYLGSPKDFIAVDKYANPWFYADKSVENCSFVQSDIIDFLRSDKGSGRNIMIAGRDDSVVDTDMSRAFNSYMALFFIELTKNIPQGGYFITHFSLNNCDVGLGNVTPKDLGFELIPQTKNPEQTDENNFWNTNIYKKL